MSTQIGVVESVINGPVAHCSIRGIIVLAVGDPIHEGFTIDTGQTGELSIRLNNGKEMFIGRDTIVAMDDTVLPDTQIDDTEQVVSGEDFDPNALEAPAAGGNELSGDGTQVIWELTRHGLSGFVDSGYDTNGPSFVVTDNPLNPLDIILEDDGEILDLVEEPVSPKVPVELPVEPEDGTPPIADPVLTTADVGDPKEIGLPEGIIFYKKITVGGGVDEGETNPPTIHEESAAMSGFDNQTSENNLDFQITRLPNYGTLYMVVDGVAQAATDTTDFDTNATFYWTATIDQVSQALSSVTSKFVGGDKANKSVWEQHGVTVHGYDMDGSNGDILTFQKDGMGVGGENDHREVPEQLAHRNGESEMIVVDFVNPVADTKITVSRLVERGEIGQVTAFLNGSEVGSWTFTDDNRLTLDGENIDFTPTTGFNTKDGSGSGSGSFTLSGVVLDQLQFTATEYADGIRSGTDSSDYFVQKIEFKELPVAEFTYTTTDEAGNTSTEAQVVIWVETDTPVPEGSQPPNEGDDSDIIMEGDNIPDEDEGEKGNQGDDTPGVGNNDEEPESPNDSENENSPSPEDEEESGDEDSDGAEKENYCETEDPKSETSVGRNNGWGNGDQDPPGNSGPNNQAENSDNNVPPGISKKDDEDTKVKGPKGNEGLGNGEDPPPPGHDENMNDFPGTSPGFPGVLFDDTTAQDF